MFLNRENQFIVRLVEPSFQYEGYEQIADPSAGTPVLGVSYDEVDIHYWAPGMTNKVLLPTMASAWKEIGDGYYSFTAPKYCFTTLGEIIFLLTSPLADDVQKIFNVEPTPAYLAVEPNVCVVFGSIVSIGGNASFRENPKIEFHTVKSPLIVNNEALVSSATVQTMVDAYGNFSIKLIQGSTVLVRAPQLGLNVQIVVPLQSAENILALLPEGVDNV